MSNEGSATWPYRGASDQRYQIKLAGTWIELASGRRWTDEARGNLPYDLAPGASTKMSLAMRAPRRAGEYRIELDMVQEGVCWFSERGSPRAHLSCRVEGVTAPPAGAPGPDVVPGQPAWPASGVLRRRLAATFLGAAYRAWRRRLAWRRSQRARQPVRGAVMEMHSIPEEEVRLVIERAGGPLITADHRIEDDGVESNYYWVTR